MKKKTEKTAWGKRKKKKKPQGSVGERQKTQQSYQESPTRNQRKRKKCELLKQKK